MSHASGRSGPPFSVVVLAGERPGGNEFSRQLGLPASVLVDVDGRPALARVVDALRQSRETCGGVLCGPERSIFDSHEVFSEILEGSGLEWLAPRSGPSRSALAAAEHVGHFPLLLTAGDHALLTPGLVDEFCCRARRRDADVVIAVVPYERVRVAYPESKRTVLRFRDGAYCGSNLFALLNREGMAGPRFWQQLEADRKRPWRMAWRIGLPALMGFLLRRFTLDQALERLSAKMGCRVACVRLETPRAAVDVDSVADRDLAVQILRSERNQRP